jgi:hypothetical protein
MIPMKCHRRQQMEILLSNHTYGILVDENTDVAVLENMTELLDLTLY